MAPTLTLVAMVVIVVIASSWYWRRTIAGLVIPAAVSFPGVLSVAFDGRIELMRVMSGLNVKSVI